MPGPKMCRMRLALGTLVITGLVVSAGNVVQVSDTASLYAAINDPANAGKTVHLKAGVYLLNANSPLVLQPGMSLEGETVLVDTDGDGLPDTASGPQSVIDGSAVTGGAKSMIEAGALPT